MNIPSVTLRHAKMNNNDLIRRASKTVNNKTYLTICLYIMEIISSLLNILSKLCRWSSSTPTVITDENFTSWLQPLVEGSE